MGKVALVSFGSAGTSIMREVAKMNLDVDMYNVNSKKTLENAKYYGFEEIELLADELKSYDTVVMTAGLGSTGGDALIKLYNLLETVRKVCFIVSPFYFELDRLMRSRSQIGQLVNEKFEGAILNLNAILKDGKDFESKKELEKAISKFDREMAEIIAEFIQEFQ